MWRQVCNRSSHPAAALAVLISTSLAYKTSSCQKKAPQDVAVYLTPASKEALAVHLSSVGVKGEVNPSRVVVKRSCQPKDYYEYEPLFGERVAFRLKGIARTDSGLAVVSRAIIFLTIRIRFQIPELT
jgi:hypothetical protein